MKKTIEHNKWASLDNLVLNEQIKVVIYLYYRFCNKEVVVLNNETSLKIWPQLFSETYLEVLFSGKKNCAMRWSFFKCYFYCSQFPTTNLRAFVVWWAPFQTLDPWTYQEDRLLGAWLSSQISWVLEGGLVLDSLCIVDDNLHLSLFLSCLFCSTGF